ncbi:MAG: PEP-CTERM sorting domain-containing protein [Pirellulaceae bacterium]
MKRTSLLAIGLALIAALCAGKPAGATTFLDDFEDNNLRDGDPVSWGGATAVDGKLQIRASGSGATIAAARVPAEVGWSMRAQGSIGDSYIFGIGIQANNSSHVYLGMFDDGRVYLGTPGVAQTVVQTDLDPASVMMRFDAFDNVLYGWAWNVGEPEPIEPLLEFTTAVTRGLPAIWNEGASGGPLVISEFDFFEASTSPLTVPEPTSLSLLTIAAIGAWMRRKCVRVSALRHA